MLIPEMFRRGVVVPLDEAAVVAFDSDDVDEGTRVRFIEIADQAEFAAIWATGLFDDINQETRSLVDDYEEETISAEMVPRLRTIVESYAKQRAGGARATRFFTALLEACYLAERLAKPVHFVL